MSLKQLIRLFLRYQLWIIAIPVLVAILVYFLSQNLSQQYESKAVIFTNPTSNRGATDGGVNRVDFYTSNNLFDNLMLLMKSRETLQDASLKLLGLHLSMEQPDPEIITSKSFKELKEHISSDLKERIAVIGDAAKTYENLKKFHQENPNSAIDYLLREHDHYGFQDLLDHLFVARKSSSDMMEVSYKSDDPGVCYFTLRFIIDSFMSNYEQMREQENFNSIKYFEEQLKSAQQRLVNSELNLKEFISSNQILNYYEQGKYLDLAKLEQDQDEELAKRLASGTKSNLDQMETLFSGFEQRKNDMDSIAVIQSEMVKKQMQLDELKVLGVNTSSYNVISKEIDALQNTLQNKTVTLFNNSLSAEGVPRKNILEEWLRLKLQYEEQIASIEVMQNRKAFINDKINEFAPLGAELNRLEREVEIMENQYLSILTGLNTANLRKYDLEMSSSQKLIDEPYLPKKALPSKRKFLVAGGLVGSGFMVVSLILLLYFLDTSLKSAERVRSLTNIPIAGGWINERILDKKVNKPLLFKRLIKQFYNHISTYFKSVKETKLILLYSIRDGEGKSFLLQKLVEELGQQDSSITCIHPDDNKMPLNTKYHYVPYAIDKIETYTQSYWDQLLSAAKGEFVVMELPNIQQHKICFELMNKADLVVLVLDASQNWNTSDKMHLENVQKGLHSPQVIWLNKMEEEALEDLNGEIPKKRNRMRIFIKELLS